MGCLDSVARVIFIVFNAIFWLSGVVVLGVGIWVLVDPQVKEYQAFLADVTDNGNFLKIGGSILIAFGSFVFIIGFCGCCGAIKMKKWLLLIYMVFLLIVFVGELAAGIYVAVNRKKVEDSFETGLSKSVKDHYSGKVEDAWNYVQEKLHCCGSTGPDTYINSTWADSQKSGIKIPASCCVLAADGKPVDLVKCQSVEANYYKEGCKEALFDWVEHNSSILIGVGIGIAILEIIGLICAIHFYRNIDRHEYIS